MIRTDYPGPGTSRVAMATNNQYNMKVPGGLWSKLSLTHQQ